MLVPVGIFSMNKSIAKMSANFLIYLLKVLLHHVNSCRLAMQVLCNNQLEVNTVYIYKLYSLKIMHVVENIHS